MKSPARDVGKISPLPESCQNSTNASSVSKKIRWPWINPENTPAETEDVLESMKLSMTGETGSD